MSGKQGADNQALPPLIAHLVESAKAVRECRYAAALTEFAHLAADYVPRHDVRLVGDGVGSTAATNQQIREIAAEHLGLTQLERRFRSVLDQSTTESGRERVEAALADVLVVRDSAHVLWGLSLGVALADHAARGRR